jgi:hypothetical protein
VKRVEAKLFGAREKPIGAIDAVAGIGWSDIQTGEGRPERSVAFQEEAAAFQLGDRREGACPQESSVQLQASDLLGRPDGGVTGARRSAVEPVEKPFYGGDVVVGGLQDVVGECRLLVGPRSPAHSMGELAQRDE